jgi:hypothetical protein
MNDCFQGHFAKFFTGTGIALGVMEDIDPTAR